jgi:hypothetical protein
MAVRFYFSVWLTKYSVAALPMPPTGVRVAAGISGSRKFRHSEGAIFV